MSSTLISMILVQVPLAYILLSYAGRKITRIWTTITIGIVLQALLLSGGYWSGG